MKQTLLLLVFIFLAIADISGQYYTNRNKIWMFGDHAGLDFTSGSPVAISSGFYTQEGTASVCDASGALLFYSDGRDVFNRTNAHMPNGYAVVPFVTTSATQGALIVPIPGNPNQYYLFSVEQTILPYVTGHCHLAYSLIDMTLDGGLGDVVTGSAGIPLNSNLCEKITAVSGNNCDVWVLVHSGTANEFLAYDVTATGVSAPVVSTVGTLTPFVSLGVIKVTPNRQKIVGQYYNAPPPTACGTELYDFDPATGIVSNAQVLATTPGQYGAEFSPDNTKLYVQIFGGGAGVFQYDISLPSTTAIVASRTNVGSVSAGGDLKLGPDGKIYVSATGDDLGRINFPNAAGAACGFVTHAIALAPGTHESLGFSNIVISAYPHDTAYTHHDTSVCIPAGGTANITAHDTGTVFSFLWDDGSTSTRSRSISSYGTYRVMIYNSCRLTIDTIHVTPLLAMSVSGTTSVCTGATVTLSPSIAGGTWSSSITSVATVTTAGVVSGVTGGTSTIVYNHATYCPVSTVITVNILPAAITGTSVVCAGGAIALSDAVSGGAWSSSNTSVATVNAATGLVTTGIAGTATISYSGCTTVTTIVTANPVPEAIAGTTHVCIGAATILTEAVTGGAWSSTNTSVATIDPSGSVGGTITGATTINYTLPTGCMIGVVVTVSPSPAGIIGVSSVCTGGTTVLTDVSSGAWSTSNSGIATITGSGVVTGLSGGATTISYTNSTGCAATRLVTVVAVPAISGVGNMCAYSSTTLTLSDPITGGVWTSTLAGISSSGVVTPYSYGVATVTYTIPGGCSATAAFTVNPLPGPVVGANHLCLGSTLYLSDTSAGGSWSSSNSVVAPISGGGALSGSFAGTTTVSYTLSTGCATTEAITVDVFPSAGSITGTAAVCVGSSTILVDVAAGGVWSASNTSVTVLGGVVFGVTAGTSTISYTVGNSCGSVSATRTVTINPLPVGGTITGASSVCTGDSVVLTDAVTGGIWSNSTAATSVTGGVVHGIATGLDTIQYTVTNSCGAALATKTITVNALPVVGPIAAETTLCMGSVFTCSDASTGGVWSISNGHLSISSAGVINAVSTGVDTITYSITNTCGTVLANYTVSVNSAPSAGVITGGASLCVGTKDTLTVAPGGGTWSSRNGKVSISSTSTSVIITGVTPGVDTIVYTLTNECGPAVAEFPVAICSREGITSPNSPQAREMLQVWPNPNEGMFTVLQTSSEDEPVRLIITNAIGEKVKEVSGITNKAIWLKLNAASGIYFISTSTANGNYVAKVVITEN